MGAHPPLPLWPMSPAPDPTLSLFPQYHLFLVLEFAEDPPESACPPPAWSTSLAEFGMDHSPTSPGPGHLPEKPGSHLTLLLFIMHHSLMCCVLACFAHLSPLE